MTTWILLRGLTREQDHWGDFVPLLRAKLPAQDTVLTPDLPGNGTLHGQDSDTRVENMVESCRQILRAQGQQPPYSVLAMSLGAMVTVAWADRYPQELTRAVLINTSLRPFSPFWHRLRPRQYPRIIQLLLTRPDARHWEEAIMAMTTRHPAAPDATLAQWLKLRAAHPVSLRNALRQLQAAIRYRAPLKRPPVPLLLLNSLGDQLVNPACSASLAKHWQLGLIKHPTAGHDLPLDAGPWVVQQVLMWLRAAPQATTPPVT
jgi:pimeloyl-ACP methyl ester carboxylesterase